MRLNTIIDLINMNDWEIDTFPVLDKGIQLKDDTLISWREINECLFKINICVRGQYSAGKFQYVKNKTIYLESKSQVGKAIKFFNGVYYV